MKNNDYIGKLVERFESGSKGCRSFSQCGPDYGLSYGTNQRILRYGIAINFLKKYFPNEASSLYWNNLPDKPLNYYPGPAYCSSPEAVKAVWLACVDKVGDDKFEEYEYIDIMERYYYPCRDLLKDVIDIDNISRAYQECIFGGSILYGGITYANLVKKCIKNNNINIATEQGKLFDLIYDQRYSDYAWERHARAEQCTWIDNSERETLRPYLTVPPLSDTISIISKTYIDSTITALTDTWLYSTFIASNSNRVTLLKPNDKRRAVLRIHVSDNTQWFVLEDNTFIPVTGDLAIGENNMQHFVVAVDSPDNILNMRDFPNSDIGNIIATFVNGNLLEVHGDCYNQGAQWYLVGYDSNTTNGFIRAKYTKRT